MSEWWTYTLADFLMFSPRIYWRPFELYIVAIGPAQFVGAAPYDMKELITKVVGLAARGVRGGTPAAPR